MVAAAKMIGTSINSAAMPAHGRSVEGAVAPFRDAVHSAVAAALQGGANAPAWLADTALQDDDEGSMTDRRAWARVAVTLVHSVATASSADSHAAAEWFGWSLSADEAATAEGIDAALAPLNKSPDIGALLPYLLDTYGRTGRLDVMRDAGKSDQRAARKAVGSFYTPEDVANFMVQSIAPSASEDDGGTWFDPACGSGVFLLAALRLQRGLSGAERREYACNRLSGCDISAQACDFAAFALLAELGKDDHPAMPVATWSSIRKSLLALDSTRLAAQGRAALSKRLSLAPGPIRLICNPPYVGGIGERISLADGYETRSLYLPFIEMAWSLASGPDDTAVLVVPLALAANRSGDHRRTRNAIAAGGGYWTMLFFDRQPHALFGEDAKTRATIAIKRPGPTPAEIRTSGLLKWTSRQRGSIMTEARAVDLGRAPIGRLIPKLASTAEVELYNALGSFALPTTPRPPLSMAAADDIVGTSLSNDVFVGGTAYNFLNIFRNYPDRLSWRGELSASGIHRIRCHVAEEADQVTALLASRCAFWLWHVECDGFHVPGWFLAESTLLNVDFDADQRARLGELGRHIWDGLQEDVLCSDNRGKLTFAFRPTAVSTERAKVDDLIIERLGLGPTIAIALTEFEQRTISIDGKVRLAKSSGKSEEKK
jgi:hypothetical protein